MGLFDSLFKKQQIPSVATFKPGSIQEAYLSIFYSVIKSDGEWGDEESASLSPLILRMGIFDVDTVSYQIMKIAADYEKHGAKTLIEEGGKMINDKYKPTLFCDCSELILADGIVTKEEEKVLEFLAKTLNINDELANKIVEVTMIRMIK